MTKHEWNRIAAAGLRMRVWHPELGYKDTPGESPSQAVQFAAYVWKQNCRELSKVCQVTIIPKDEAEAERLEQFVKSRWKDGGSG